MGARIKPYSFEWLVDFVENTDLGEYKRNGNWLTLLCPFHNESRPSFGINITSGSYNCFSCGVTGTFEMLLEHLNVEMDNVPILDVPDMSKIRMKKEKNKKSKDRYSDKFRELDGSNKSNIIIKYLKSRGIYNPNLYRSLKIGYIDYGDFKRRIVLPIFDERGKNVLWYEGRKIGRGEPKYFRSKNSNVKEILYPYHLVKKAENVVIVEGLFDVIKLLSFGIPALCTFGSMIHPEQIALLARFTNVVMCFDNDKAGRKGMGKFRKILLSTDLPSNYYYLRLPRKINDIGEVKDKQQVMRYLKNKKLMK